jgi:hypothetical protein
MSCRAHCPHPFPVIGANESGQPEIMGKLSMFPKVEPNWYCGEYKRSLLASVSD